MIKLIPSIGYHKDGSIWNKGQMLDGEMHGYWQFYRKGGGAIMRSGSFDHGVQTGEWVTYDSSGKVFKITVLKAPMVRAAEKKDATKAHPKSKKPTKVAPAKAAKTPTSAPTRAKSKRKAAAELTADELMARLDHPLKADFEAVRKVILSADKSIVDGVKWNSLSFRTTEWFATVNRRSRDTVQLVLHLGAKVGKEASTDAIPDPKGLLKWLGKDRAMATLRSGLTLKANLPALKTLVKAWIRYV